MEKKSPLLKGHQDIVSIIYSNRLLFMKNLLRDPAFYNDHARQFPWTAHQSFPWIDQRAMNPWTPEVDEELSSPTPPALFDAGLPGWGFKFKKKKQYPQGKDLIIQPFPGKAGKTSSQQKVPANSGLKKRV